MTNDEIDQMVTIDKFNGYGTPWYIVAVEGVQIRRLETQDDADYLAGKLRTALRARIPADDGRDGRQQRVAEWVVAAFGKEHQTSVTQRAVRLLEEAIELYQAAGAEAEMAHRLVDYIFAKPAGDVRQEMGGVGVTLLAFASAAGISADAAEAAELARVLAKPLAHFYARNVAKNEAGFDACAYPVAPPRGKEEGE